MPVTLLGQEVLQEYFLGNGRVTVANRDSPGRTLCILAATIVRHDSAGSISRQAVWELDLEPGEAQSVDPCEAFDQPPAGIEVLLRLFSPDQRGLRDVYLSSPLDAAPAREWEVGVRPDTDPAEDLEEFAMPESPGLMAYIRTVQ
jgi:hypothetical protein